MWMNDIGRFQASNYSLLKTVFELNLQLFLKDQSSKTLLLFVIRDHIAQTSPLHVLQKQILQDIDKIWNSIIKTPQFTESKVSDFFDFQFTSLPHKQLQEKEWYDQVAVMRNMFTDPNNEHYVFLEKYKKAVPIDGFQHYASAIWDVIINNKDLDLPTQKEMLAMYRCGEIAKEVHVPFEQLAIDWKKRIASKQIITRFGELAQEQVEQVLAEFDKQTSLYVRDVAQRRRSELETRMKTELLLLYNGQLDLIRTNALEFFQKLLSAATAKGSILTDFSAAVAQIKTKIEEFFTDGAKQSMYPGETWEYDQQLDTLRSEIDRFVAQARKDQMNALLTQESKTVSDDINANMGALLNNPSIEMWNNVRESMAHIMKDVEEYMTQVLLDGFQVNQTELEDYMERLRNNARDLLFNKMKESATHLNLRMHKKFEDAFRFENGLPRVFRKLEDITAKFQTAREHALKFLDLFFLFRLDAALDDYHLDLDADVDQGDFHYPQSSNPEFERNLLLSEDACMRIFDNFSLKCTGSLKDAQANYLAQQAKKTNLPLWIFPVLLVLGWNEIMYLLSSPLLLLLTIILGIFFFWTYLRGELYSYIDSEDANPTLAIGLRLVLGWLDKILTPAMLLAGRQEPVAAVPTPVVEEETLSKRKKAD